jgi:hypothetical protein
MMDNVMLSRAVHYTLHLPLQETKFNYTLLEVPSGDSRIYGRREHTEVWRWRQFFYQSIIQEPELLSTYINCYTHYWPKHVIFIYV